MKKQSSFYVGIPESEEVRTDLLNSSKSIISSLKRYGNYKKIREEKLELVKQLGASIKDLNFSVSKISDFLPEQKEEAVSANFSFAKKNLENFGKKVFKTNAKKSLTYGLQKKPEQKPKRIEELFEQKLEEIERRLHALK